MSKDKKTTKLFNEFPPTSTESWKEKITTDLKGADFNKKLVWRTMEGFNVQPFYRSENLKGLEHLQCNPGEFPFVRGNKTKDNDWLIRQDIEVSNINEANTKALEILNKGVESIGFNFHPNLQPTKSDFKALLKDIVIECIEINFNITSILEKAVNELISFVKEEKLDADKLNISINFDPIGKFILQGKFDGSQDQEFNIAKQLIELTKDFKHIKPIVINGATFKNAGANISQELAYTISIGNEYLSKLSELGVSPELINSKIKFEFSVGTNYFMEIAKFRAARYLWAQVVRQYNVAEELCKMHIHAKTSEWHKSIYDPYVNTLRSTTEAMSAAIGSVESLTIEPFDTLYESITNQSERIARNQQIIIKEESYFKNIIDPSAGSYYIETLTNELIKSAWDIFISIDDNYGFIETFKKEIIQNTLEQGQQKRLEAIALRKEKFLGVGEFPNVNEKHEDYKPELFDSINRTAKDAIVKGLTTYRGPQAFEKMRNRTDIYSKTNKRPVAFMLTYGNLGMRLARSQFSQNFFATAGFEVIDNHGFKTIEDGISQAINQKAEIVVLCSSDDEYPIITPEAIKLLNNNAILVIAGYPKNVIEELTKAGVKHFIHIKSNMIETLEGFQKQIGIL